VHYLEEQFISMISEVNLVGESSGWWMNTRASHHICCDCAMFKTYVAGANKKMLLENSYTTT